MKNFSNIFFRHKNENEIIYILYFQPALIERIFDYKDPNKKHYEIRTHICLEGS